jgi:protein required for attachment to host cells
MSKTWVLVAHRAGARLFESGVPGAGLRRIEEIPHPAGRLENRQIGSDKPGRSFDSHGAGRHALGKEHDEAETVAQAFAHKLAAHLDNARANNAFDKLVLVAEPRFLGMLRAALSAPTAARVSADVEKDLGHVSDHDLPAHLGGAI